MNKFSVGDRVIGNEHTVRQGKTATVLAVLGSYVRVCWDDGHPEDARNVLRFNPLYEDPFHKEVLSYIQRELPP